MSISVAPAEDPDPCCCLAGVDAPDADSDTDRVELDEETDLDLIAEGLSASYTTRRLAFSQSNLSTTFLAPLNLVTAGGPPLLMANSPMPATCAII